VSCGLYEGGVASESDGGLDAATEVAVDAAAEAPSMSCATTSKECSSAVPAGWNVVAIETSRAFACPSNFGADHRSPTTGRRMLV